MQRAMGGEARPALWVRGTASIRAALLLSHGVKPRLTFPTPVRPPRHSPRPWALRASSRSRVRMQILLVAVVQRKRTAGWTHRIPTCCWSQAAERKPRFSIEAGKRRASSGWTQSHETPAAFMGG